MTTTFPAGFLWGASTAAHQTEGNNVNSDMWASEGMVPGMERSGDACDSYHRWREDMQLVADAGLTAYRFSIEWARIEPVPGEFSRAELAHYRRMIDHAFALGLTPVVTLHHFTVPRWFAERGGWMVDDAPEVFAQYVRKAATILDGVEWIVTINEPNILAMMIGMARAMADAPEGAAEQEWQSPTVDDEREKEAAARPPVLPAPDPEIGGRLIAAHHAARSVLREVSTAKVGWSVANRAFVARPGGEERMKAEQHVREDLYLEAARDDDFIGVQAYSSQWVGSDGIEPHPPHPDNTLVNTAYRPDALGIAVRHVADVIPDVPVLVTENGIATADDDRRIAYTTGALEALAAAMRDGIDVRGYLHWSLLDNFEWGHWEPTFGLVAVNRETFERSAKPSLAWLGSVASAGAISS